VRAQLTRRRLDRLAELTTEIKELTTLITATMQTVTTGLTDRYGVGPVGAATILGEVADIRRYRSRHAFAAANGTAPIPASSGRTARHRLNRSGNRTLNRVLYTATRGPQVLRTPRTPRGDIARGRVTVEVTWSWKRHPSPTSRGAHCSTSRYLVTVGLSRSSSVTR
jgi:transposase